MSFKTNTPEKYLLTIEFRYSGEPQGEWDSTHKPDVNAELLDALKDVKHTVGVLTKNPFSPLLMETINNAIKNAES